MGQSEQVQLIFARKLRKATVPSGQCRTRLITKGVIPSLHVYRKNPFFKQYWKEGRGLRTEMTINNTYDLRRIGFAANRAGVGGGETQPRLPDWDRGFQENCKDQP